MPAIAQIPAVCFIIVSPFIGCPDGHPEPHTSLAGRQSPDGDFVSTFKADCADL
ncbi:hypothetical protein KBAD11_11830 [Aeromonas dhakensis]|nr:hypothetical protein KBAD45_11830 [Aeromonas dhakensis]CAD7496665.1 hypothetical protein KBAD59_11860 [Aeromonas dhakensis]CAD7496964.1 hypothetical protein KBAD11_11830 [Aeromonas dhakensis]CAD7507651.1 hypothetical protein KBAD14_KBAD14_11840 [Aeromonas dhakensis]CAD7507775.1 hypothetical protein KBAD10_11850 [Aeromonas dhakensis]